MNLNHVDIRLQSQMDTTACIFLFSRQIPRSIVRFMPFADMVTGENKSCRKTARNYCEQKVFLYPKHLKMVGRYNSLFGYDGKILWDEKQLQDYLEQGIDRIVVNVSL